MIDLNINEYKTLAMRTFANLPHKESLIESVFGLVGESGEIIEIINRHIYRGEYYCNDKLIEEIGDVMWYIAEFSYVHGIGMIELFGEIASPEEYQLKRAIYSEPSIVICVFKLTSNISKIADLVKKHLYQGHPLDRDRVEPVLKIVIEVLVDICTRYGINFSDTLVRNIEKLKRRYPRGFSIEDSINRGGEDEDEN